MVIDGWNANASPARDDRIVATTMLMFLMIELFECDEMESKIERIPLKGYCSGGENWTKLDSSVKEEREEAGSSHIIKVILVISKDYLIPRWI